MGSVVSGIGSIFGDNSKPDNSNFNNLTSASQSAGNGILGNINSAAGIQQQSDFQNALYNQATGNAPSIANATLSQGLDKSLAQQMSAAKSNRAVNPALAARSVNAAAASNAQQLSQQGAINRLNEQQANQQQYASFLKNQQGSAANFLNGATNSEGQSQAINAQQQGRSDGIIGAGLNSVGGFLGFNEGGVVPGFQDALMKAHYAGQKARKAKKMAAGGMAQNPYGDGGSFAAAFGKAHAPKKASTPKVTAPDAVANPNEMVGEPTDYVSPGTMMAAQGAMVPGKPVVKGDSEKNDFIKALLSPGEIVIPRTVVAQGGEAIADFAEEAKAKAAGTPDGAKHPVDAHHPETKMSSGGKVADKGFGALLRAQAEMNQKLVELAKKYKG